jgi:hypothetical protein
MANGDQLTQMVSDPDFGKMPLTEQRKALSAYDPGFGQMGDSDLSKFVSAHQGQTPGASQITGISQDPANKPFTLPWLKRQGISAVDALTQDLPAIGGVLGGAAGSEAGPVGAMGGSGMGAMGGTAAKQMIRRWMGFGDSPTTAGAAANEITGQGLTNAALQGTGDAASAVLKKAAPSMAESALNVTERMRGRGRTIGKAALDETSGVRPKTIKAQATSRLGELTGQMEDAVHQATQQGAVGSTLPAHQALNDAIDSMPRNAHSLRAKVMDLGSLLDLRPPGSIGPVPTDFTPDELLEIKRGIGKEIGSWPPEWQKMPDVKSVQSKLYGALDGELDRLVPGNQQSNQTISSLIPVKQQATRLSDAASTSQRIAHRVAAHTGALAGTGIGGYMGYREGGPRGAAIGAAAGLALPELLASPTAQMTGARLTNAAGEYGVPAALPFLRTLASKQQGKKTDNTQQQ